MRLLFGEQLSEALVTAVADLFPDSLHVRLLGKGGAADRDVWGLAREHDCVLVTKGEDFHRRSVLRGAPPKVVWLRVGNCSTKDFADLLRQHVDDLTDSKHRTRRRFWNWGVSVRTERPNTRWSRRCLGATAGTAAQR